VNAETGRTRTLVFGVQNAHMMYAEAIDQSYELWIPDFDTNQLLRYNSTRNATRPVTSEALNGPWGIVPFNENEFLITNIRGNNIVSISREGDVREVATGFRAPAGIAIDAEQQIVYVVNNGSARRAIEWFAFSDLNADAPVADIGKPLVSGLQNPSGIILAPDGYLYFTYSLGTRGVVGRVNPSECIDGGCTNEQVEIVVYTDLQAPLAGLAISPDMRLFVHTIFRPEIYWVDLYN
jgi:sugar lactone lactonase YvrE